MSRSKFVWSLVLGIAACGSEEPVGDFSACGGDLVAGWELTEVAHEGAPTYACGSGAVSGTLFFNPNGRYSLNVDIQAWTRTAGGDCGFTAVYGGFYRTDGTTVCLGDSSASGADIPCDGARPTSQHATGAYCVDADTLQVRSADFLDPGTSTTFTFRRRS